MLKDITEIKSKWKMKDLNWKTTHFCFFLEYYRLIWLKSQGLRTWMQEVWKQFFFILSYYLPLYFITTTFDFFWKADQTKFCVWILRIFSMENISSLGMIKIIDIECSHFWRVDVWNRIQNRNVINESYSLFPKFFFSESYNEIILGL